MELQISFFGITKDIVGEKKLKIETTPCITAQNLVKLLILHYPDLSKISSLVLAVNNEYASEDLILSANDTIALIPPVSGG